MKYVIKKILGMILVSSLFLLTSCGDGCYQDPSIGGNVEPSYSRTYNADIQASNPNWVNTGINLSAPSGEMPLTDTFTVSSVSGTGSCMKNPNAPGQCAINYATMCEGGNQYVCNDPGTCNNTQLIDPCTAASQPGCTQGECCVGQGDTCAVSSGCAGNSGQQMCWNGQLYQSMCYSTNQTCDPGSCSGGTPCTVCTCGSANCSASPQWVNTCSQCTESVSCDSSSNKYINFTYTVTKSTGDVYTCNNPVDVGVCTQAEVQCPYGVAKLVYSTTQNWTQIDTNVLPGDDIYLKVLSPTLGSGIQVPMSSTPMPGNPYLNAWSSTINWRYTDSANQCGSSSQQNCPCPTIANGVPLQVTQNSQYSSCPFLDQGYYTCPMCEGPNRGWASGLSNASIWAQCDGAGEAFQCWYTGGSGMWLKIIDASESCSSQLNCNSGDQNCIWFDQYVGDNTTSGSIFGLIEYQPSTFDGPNCQNGGDYSYCNNRLTTRHMTGSGSGYTQICAKMADEIGSFGDNLGGYVIYDTRTSCVGYNGMPSAAASTINAPNAMALEYIIVDPSTSQPPSSNTTGTLFCSVAEGGCNPTGNINNLQVQGAGTGILYLRVRDCNGCYGDNTGAYSVNIQYTQYLSSGVISNLIEELRNMIFDISFSVIEPYFSNFCVGSGCSASGVQFVQYIRVLLVLYIAFYGISFTIGTVSISQKELLKMAFKIGLVLTIISPNGFDFFYNDFFKLFFSGMNDLIVDAQIGFGSAQVTPPSPSSPSPPVFAFADNMISLTFLSSTTWLKLLALSGISPMGLILSVLMLIGVVLFLIGIFKAVLVYLMSILVLCILILLAPIFIPFYLFDMTKKLFDNWINAFVRYSLEPVILIIGLSLLTELAYVLLIQIINFQVCWKCIWPINFDFIPSIVSAMNLTETIFCIEFFAPFGMMPGGASALMSAIGVQVVDILLFVIIGHLMMGYDKFVSEITERITGGAAGKFSREGGSVGSAVFNRGRAAFRMTGIPDKVDNFVGNQKKKLKRAAIGMFRTSNEDKLLKEAKRTEDMYNAKQVGMARYMSDTVTNALSHDPYGAFKNNFDTLNNKNASVADQAQAARSLGMGLYGAMSNRSANETDAYYESRQQTKDYFINNLSKLSSVEDGSAAYDKLSPQAIALRDALNRQGASDALKTLRDRDATDNDKRDAMGALAQSMFVNDADAHKLFFNPADANERAKLIEEVMKLDRVPDSEIKRPAVK